MSNRANLLSFMVVTLLPTVSFAQCVNEATPSCAVYEKCFAKYCPCPDGPDEYFKTYGATYCKAFLENTSLSPEGKKWRDATLSCLQEKIVPKLDIVAIPSCNCSAMRKFAFSTHVECYTQDGTSICNLPASDVASISATVDLKDMFDPVGWQQMKAVAMICESTAPDDGRRTAWKAIAALLKTR